MNTERIKSVILFLLVTMSFVLTTRIWFYISIEGLFVIPSNKQTAQSEFAYEKESLLKPSKLVVHIGEYPVLLFNNEKDKEYYNFVLTGAKDVLWNWLSSHDSYSQSRLSLEELDSIRNKKTVELIFKNPMEYSNLIGLMDVSRSSWNDIKYINSIIIDPYEGKLHIVDESKGGIYEFKSAQMPSILKGLISEIEKRDGFTYDISLNVYNMDEVDLYGDYAIAPISVATMPALKVKREIEADTKLNKEVLKFFDDNDSSNINGMKDENGSVTFTDREEEAVTIDMSGAIEYYKYNISSDNTAFTELREALDIATQYINEHLGFTYDMYLSGVKSSTQGGRTSSYIISFDYKYNGVPIITELDTGSSAIEIEIQGNEVKRYKRNVRVIEDQNKTVNIKSSLDILDIVWGNLDNYLNAIKSESIVTLNDIYLAYFERNDVLIPVWVIDVLVENEKLETYNKRYLIGAEEGSLEEGVVLGEK